MNYARGRYGKSITKGHEKKDLGAELEKTKITHRSVCCCCCCCWLLFHQNHSKTATSPRGAGHTPTGREGVC